VLDRFDGAVMVVAALCYTAAILWLARREGRAVQAEFADDLVLGYGVKLLDRSQFIRSALGLAVGIAIIVIGADWLVDGGVALARRWGVSDAFIGLTIVALGTSSPELVTAIVSTIRKERDIAVGNLIGSSVYNILAILGITALAPASGVPVTPELIRVDIPVMVATGFACVPVFLSGMRVTRGEGALFVGAYLLYLTYLIVSRA
jgi:cation:H+ antiporter